jgi:transposase-like protein
MQRNGLQNGKQRWRCHVCSATLTEESQGKGRPVKYEDNAQKQKKYRERKQMKAKIEQAIATYNAGDKLGALQMIEQLLSSVSLQDALKLKQATRDVDATHKRSPTLPTIKQAAYEWLALARDRLEQEIEGNFENGYAGVPVLVGLNSAIATIT